MTSLTDDVARLLDERSGRVVVGLTGPPGVGKSTVAARIVDEFNSTRSDFAALVPMDGFHLSNAQLVRLRRKGRKGAPDTFDAAGYLATLTRVRDAYQTADVFVPQFDRAIEESVAAGLVVPASARLVVTEGNYLALPSNGFAGARQLVDRLYYLRGVEAVRRQRLLARHITGGRSLIAAERWVIAVDEPNAELIAGTESRCDGTWDVDEVAVS
ncbi:nucleoside/nucleotide kinase family protein [Mycobacterium sp. CBMA293]|uniref:nucleoside/nucleotide kinase family protein n=1 Tax=unclassified Mycolicibacterium TaxID=2636767 RepID=UPI0012DFE2ED|nr:MULTISPECIES: nucleoside/nucleotide kinase family protein [unclassified Mycolicibacterium]MUL45432.1 nucleoside/nucleotide kinase family protein [Mycolicibacterium sp. CBMA 360]MUL56953.1 nucleoside/nucleotide kinase family protein [Mycolicibacterium sp. CBMA 335]MUL69993.1 nucleoside/nucleotide kinase family protein [Mycolicibacterium sp. CBMA 311]MUL92041.1 nucleoside/nucleotide kinase family protein [Mycolicibacterium sp. CBMA 230]MUM05779.1 nucleoside/nucleotide kinase family protein [M